MLCRGDVNFAMDCLRVATGLCKAGCEVLVSVFVLLVVGEDM